MDNTLEEIYWRNKRIHPSFGTVTASDGKKCCNCGILFSHDHYVSELCNSSDGSSWCISCDDCFTKVLEERFSNKGINFSFSYYKWGSISGYALLGYYVPVGSENWLHKGLCPKWKNRSEWFSLRSK